MGNRAPKPIKTSLLNKGKYCFFTIIRIMIVNTMDIWAPILLGRKRRLLPAQIPIPKSSQAVFERSREKKNRKTATNPKNSEYSSVILPPIKRLFKPYSQMTELNNATPVPNCFRKAVYPNREAIDNNINSMIHPPNESHVQATAQPRSSGKSREVCYPRQPGKAHLRAKYGCLYT